MAIASINPATGEKLKEFAPFNDEEIEKRLKRAEHAFTHHRRQPFAKRGQLMMAVASLLEQERDKLARTDRKSTRLNSSHRCISYAVFCLTKKNNKAQNKVHA